MNELTKAARELSRRGASKGGKARAESLTPSGRKEIAQLAARARWAKKQRAGSEGQASGSVDHGQDETAMTLRGKDRLPIMYFKGKVQMGTLELQCYVLDNGKRVIAQREVVRALTGQAKGNLSRYIETPNLDPYIDSDLIADRTIHFSIPGNPKVAIGYEATLLVDICEAYLWARDAGKLAVNQLHLARQAEIIMRACAKVGIIALIDEATGYQEFRKKQELQLKLQAFIADEMQEWAKMFPDEFWFELARLEGIQYSPRSRPLRWGKYVMMFVYDSVDADVGKELRKKNPDPHFLKNHHQWLKQFGKEKVHDQITRVVTVMKLCTDMNDFKQKFSRLFERQLNFNWSVAE